MTTRLQTLENRFLGIKLLHILKPISTLSITEPHHIIQESMTDNPLITIKNATLEQAKNSIFNQFGVGPLEGEEASYLNHSTGWYLSYLNNQPIASISSMIKSNHTAWIGYYYVEPDFRAKGYGKRLFDTIIAKDRAEKNVKAHALTCMENLAPMYQKSGFSIIGTDTIYHASLQTSKKPQVNLSSITMDINFFHELSKYDSRVQLGLQRDVFLYHWLSKPYTEVIVAQLENTIVGYNVISDYRFPINDNTPLVQRMGPLYADTMDIAELLIYAGLSLTTKENILIDADSCNPLSNEAIAQTGLFNKYLTLCRMSNFSSQNYDFNRVYSLVDYGTGP